MLKKKNEMQLKDSSNSVVFEVKYLFFIIA
jgi:hypothetical protein